MNDALADLRAAGYQPRCYRDFPAGHAYLCGDDEQRADELNRAFRDNEARAIVAVRGGYGVGRLLDRLDYGALAADPKPVVGYSDLTALHLAIQRTTGLVTFHGPNAIDGITGRGKLDEASAARWRSTLAGGFEPGADLFAGFTRGVEVLAHGEAEGVLVGGNLAVLAGLLGTRFEPQADPIVLMIEDTGEPPYRIDRLLCQLRLAGLLERAAAVLLGQFTDCGDVEPVLHDYFLGLGVPVLVNCPLGHATPNAVLPHGAVVRVETQPPRVLLPMRTA